MKRFLMCFAAVVLVFAVAKPMAVLANEEPVDVSAYMRTVDGVEFVMLRFALEVMGADARWDSVNRVVVITNALGVMSILDINAVGGFVEGGRSWVPLDFAMGELMEMIYVPYGAVRVDRLDLTLWDAENFADVREASFDTDLPLGEIGVGFIRYMSANLGLRTPFTYKELEAAVWIIEELLAMGHDWDNIEVQEFTYWCLIDADIEMLPDVWMMVTSPWILGEGRHEQIRQDRVSQNIVLTLPGESDRKIIVGAHYDSVPYPGASDNASGTALLLESAQRMLGVDHYHTIVYVFFGAEEVGLFGAFYFYYLLTPAQRENIVMMVNADVLIEGPYLIYGAGIIPTGDDGGFDFDLILEGFMGLVILQLAELGIDFDELPPEVVDDIFMEVLASFAELPDFTILTQTFMMGLMEPEVNEDALLIRDMAEALSAANDFEFIFLPEAIGFSSYNLVFLSYGYTVVNFVGLERVENLLPEDWAMPMHEVFSVTVLHSPRDEFYYIEARWPGMMMDNMRAFGLLLEGILTSRF